MGVSLTAATANPKKLAEIEAILAGDVTLLPRPADLPDVDETADTLAGNAELKAVAVAEAAGGPAVADDTGLEVDALDGAPGVRSARFAGEPADDARNVALLLERLAGVPDAEADAAIVRADARIDRAKPVVSAIAAAALDARLARHEVDLVIDDGHVGGAQLVELQSRFNAFAR